MIKKVNRFFKKLRLNNVNRKVKIILCSTFSKFNYPLLVNSYGRSGSTVLTQSIVEGASTTISKIIEDDVDRYISQTAWNLEKIKLKNGIVYKTHDYPPSKIYNEKVKMLYTFSNPVDVVLSLLRLYDNLGEHWMRKHYDHLKVPYNNFKEIISEDNLQLEQHLDTWLHENRFPVAFVRYETMWEHQDEISNFLGFEVQLPPKREREAKKERPKELVDNLSVTYETLRNKLDKLDDFFVK